MNAEKQTLHLVQTHLEVDPEFTEILIDEEQNKLLYMTMLVCMLILLLNYMAW